MPTSHFYQLGTIVEIMVLMAPKSILDVGAGFGKYGVLAREYLDIRDPGGQYAVWNRRIDAIEIFDRYLTALHQFIYDQIYIGDAVSVFADIDRTYDLILLVDILEHLDVEGGRDLLSRSMGIARNTLVSTPKRFWAQPEAHGNPHERHRSHWPAKSFGWIENKCFIPDDFSVICFIGQDAPVVKRHFYHWRRRLKHWFPVLKYPYRLLRRRRPDGP